MNIFEKVLMPLCEFYELFYTVIDQPDQNRWLIRFDRDDKSYLHYIDKFIFCRYNNIGKELYLNSLVDSVIEKIGDGV